MYYAIFLKKRNEPWHHPTSNKQPVFSLKAARKYRNLDIAINDFRDCINSYPEFYWTIRNIKTDEVIMNNGMSVLKIWESTRKTNND